MDSMKKLVHENKKRLSFAGANPVFITDSGPVGALVERVAWGRGGHREHWSCDD